MKEAKLGQSQQREHIVQKEMLANSVGSGSIAVLSTPMLIAFMEGAAANLIQGFLEEDCTSVGTQIQIEHLCPSTEGAKILAKAKLTAITGRKYSFEIEAFDEAGLIAKGVHERVSIRINSFMKKAEERQETKNV